MKSLHPCFKLWFLGCTVLCSFYNPSWETVPLPVASCARLRQVWLSAVLHPLLEQVSDKWSFSSKERMLGKGYAKGHRKKTLYHMLFMEAWVNHTKTILKCFCASPLCLTCGIRGVTKEGKGVQFPGRRIIMGAPNHCGRPRMAAVGPKRPNNVTSTSFSTAHLLRKDLSFEHGGAKFNCFLPRAPSNPVTPLYGIALSFAKSRSRHFVFRQC